LQQKIHATPRAQKANATMTRRIPQEARDLLTEHNRRLNQCVNPDSYLKNFCVLGALRG